MFGSAFRIASIAGSLHHFLVKHTGFPEHERGNDFGPVD